MKKCIATLLLLSFLMPLRAGVILAAANGEPVRLAGLASDFDPLEKNLLDGSGTPKFQDDMQRQIKKDQEAPLKSAGPREAEKGSSWWKWALGILIVGGIAAAAGGGGGGGGGSSTSSSGGTVATTW